MKAAGNLLIWSLIAGLLTFLLYVVIQQFFGKTDFPIGAAVGGGLAAYGAYRANRRQQNSR